MDATDVETGRAFRLRHGRFDRLQVGLGLGRTTHFDWASPHIRRIHLNSNFIILAFSMNQGINTRIDAYGPKLL